MTESVILCEGYHDRAFWAGWLLHLGCEDLSEGGKKKVIYDPWNKRVISGQYAYHSRSGDFLRIQPCGGDSNVWPALRSRIVDLTTRPCNRLIVSVDLDCAAGPATLQSLSLLRQSLQDRVRSSDPNATKISDDEYAVAQGTTTVSMIVWHTSEPSQQDIPDVQTLERLVTAALCAAYPQRATAVSTWLGSRPSAPAAGAKAFAWSHNGRVVRGIGLRSLL